MIRPRSVVDADGHVLERPTPGSSTSILSTGIGPIRIDRDEHGYEVLLIDGQPLKTLRGQLGALGGIDMDAAKLLTRGQISYAEGSRRPRTIPPRALRVMTRGIDAVLLYPTIGICWEGHVTDGALATAYTRATTAGWPSSAAPTPRGSIRWRTSRCSTPKARWEETIRRAGTAAWESISRRTSPHAAGRHFDDPIFAAVLETAQELEMPIGFHVVVRDRPWFRQWQRRDPSDGLFSIVSSPSTSWPPSPRC